MSWVGLTPEQAWWVRAKVDKSDQCWEWNGTVKPDGYSFLWSGGRGHSAHRVGYEMLREKIPPDLCCDHLCRNRACVNPWHIELVTSVENVRRGEGPSARKGRMTHCLKGHPLSGHNLVVRASGYRGCRTCMNASGREYKRKRRLDPAFREMRRLQENARYAAKKAMV